MTLHFILFCMCTSEFLFSPAELKTMLLQMAFNWKSLFYVAQISLITKLCWRTHISFLGCHWDVTRFYIHNSTITSNYAAVSQNIVQPNTGVSRRYSLKWNIRVSPLAKCFETHLKSLLCPQNKCRRRELTWNIDSETIALGHKQPCKKQFNYSARISHNFIFIIWVWTVIKR